MADETRTVVCPNPYHRSAEVEVGGETHEVSFETEGGVAKATGLSADVADALLKQEGYRAPAPREDEVTDGTDDLEMTRTSTVQGIGPAREEGLNSAGIPSVEALAEADAEDVADAIGVNEETASTLIGHAKAHLSE